MFYLVISLVAVVIGALMVYRVLVHNSDGRAVYYEEAVAFFLLKLGLTEAAREWDLRAAMRDE